MRVRNRYFEGERRQVLRKEGKREAGESEMAANSVGNFVGKKSQFLSFFLIFKWQFSGGSDQCVGQTAIRWLYHQYTQLTLHPWQIWAEVLPKSDSHGALPYRMDDLNLVRVDRLDEISTSLAIYWSDPQLFLHKITYLVNAYWLNDTSTISWQFSPILTKLATRSQS